MIEGLQIKVTGKELKGHIMERAAFHKTKADWYSKQVQNLKDGGVEPQDVSMDPASSLRHKAQTHIDKAAYFSFLGEHIIESEEYMLQESDLSRIEIASRYF